MKAELTAIIEAAKEGGYWAICPEIAGANGQGETIAEAKANLKSAIELILEDPLADHLNREYLLNANQRTEYRTIP
jgi:predicted RNase H-like HicB family nuclease